MASTIVDRLHSDFSELIVLLQESNEISLISSAEENFKKSLLLAAASYFENHLSECVMSFTCEIAGNDNIISSLVKSKAVTRQYHTWFKWDGNNANTFFSLFGEGFSRLAKAEVRDSPILDSSIKAFLTIGNDRNRLVHQDFGNFTIEKTTTEIHELYQQAMYFTEWLPRYLRSNSNVSAA